MNRKTVMALPGRRELVVVRVFEAPRELVQKAYTDAEWHTRWLGAPRTTNKWFSFELPDESGHVSLEPTRFEELPGSRTRVISRAVFPCVADRDRMIARGVPKRLDERYARLDDLLAQAMVAENGALQSAETRP